MRIGINASFLRKPGTGIGQVTFNFLEKLKDSTISNQRLTFVLYTEGPIDLKLPENFTVRSFLPFWKRDDLVRKWLWERQVVQEAKRDGCQAFLSLYQSSSVFEKSFCHVMVVHDVIPRLFTEYQGNFRQKWYWRKVESGIRGATKLVAISQSTKNDLVELGINQEVTVAYPDTAPVFYAEPSSLEVDRVLGRYGLRPGYLYHGGGFEVRKNSQRVLEAYRILLDKEDQGSIVPPLVLSGKVFTESNPLATPVRTLVHKLELEGRVRMLDFVPEADLPVLYKQALFFVYPSRYEGFGLPVLEALRMGTPVLTSDVSSLPEVARDAALYIDPENTESLASGMERLIRDADLRKRLAEVAPKEVSRFSWSTFVEIILRSLVP